MENKTLQNSTAMRLKQLRKSHYLTMEVFAKRVGLSKSAISLFEKGTNSPKLDTLDRIAQEFSVTVEWLLGRSERGGVSAASLSTAEMVGSYADQEFLELPFIEPTAYGTFAQNCLDPDPEAFSTIRIVRMPGHKYQGAAVIEVRGNSMAPKYPERARFVVRPVSDGNWQHSQGVHAIALRSQMFLIKRITSNRDGIIELTSDSTGEQMEITLGDINCMWKVGEAIYFPAED